MPVGQGARNNIILGGLGRPQLFDTNIKATSIDEDIFSDQTEVTGVADADLVLVLDVSETPDKIKFITHANLTAGFPVLTGSTDNTLVTVTGTGTIAGEANLLFDGTILTNDGGEVDIDISSGDPHLSFQIGGTDKFTLGVDDDDSDKLKIDTGGTVGGATKLTLDSSGNLTVAGDLTISGDDLTMGTNTDTALLIADGSNFNPVAVSSLSEISTVANDDVFIAVDTSGGGFKKIERSTLVAGIATGSELSNVIEDTSPQLGGDLDVNGNDLVSTSNANISLLPNGSGKVIADGNGSSGGISLSDGIIDIRTGTGSVAKILFYCESSNAHAQTLQSQPHVAGVTNTLTLPAGSNSTLVSRVSTDTLTNKTLTSPVINTGTFGTSILPVSADGTTLGSASKEFSDLFLADSGQILFGNDQEITLTHVADDGLVLKHVGTGDGKEPSFSFHAGDNDIAANDVLGSIFFKAPDEGAGTDAILIAAGIEAVSEGDFAADNNATKLSFLTGASEAAAEKMSLSSAGLLTIADDFMIKDGGTIGVASTNDALTISSAGIVTFKDDIVIKDGGTIGVSSAADALTISSAGIVTFKDDIIIKDAGTIGSASDTDAIGISSGGVVSITATTANTDATDGALTVAGGASVAADLTVGDDLRLLTDSAILSLGAGSDATLTHDGTTGLTIAATPISIDSTGSLDLNSTTGDINLQDGGVNQISFDLDGTSGEVIMKPMVNSDDLVIQQFDGTEVIRIEDDASLGLVGNKLNIANSSGDVIIKPLDDEKDIIFQQRDGTEVARIEDNATFNVVTSKLAINGTAVTSTAAELNLLDGVSGLVQADLTKLAAVDSTAGELNLLDGSAKSTASITIADADGFIVIDGTTTKQIPASDIKTYAAGSAATKGFATAMAIAL